MKKILFAQILIAFLSSLAVAATPESLDYKRTMDARDYKGISFLAFMQERVKPELDRFATEGFELADGDRALSVLDKVSKKVRSGALRAARSQEALVEVANHMRAAHGSVTFYDLPSKIASIDRKVDRYDLSTYLALASGGGIAIRLDDSNTYYNVNYGTGSQDKDEMTGRSFSATPLHNADDISDKSYLRDLETFIRSSENPHDFYSVIISGLVDMDFSSYARLNDLGQSVATDFFAIYTAEQDRHLMTGLKAHPWDVALLEVTLLSALHAGQEKVAVFHTGELRHQVPNQSRCGEPVTKIREASMIDYWQFTTNPDPKSCGRSGINITKKEFRALGAAVTAFEREHNPEVVAKVERHFKSQKSSGNLFQSFTKHLISASAPRSFGKDGDALEKDMIEFLDQVRRDADAITSSIQAK